MKLDAWLSRISAVEVIQVEKLGYSRTDLYMPGPVGGPLSKDPHILSEGLKTFDVNIELASISRQVNESLPKNILGTIKEFYWSLLLIKIFIK